MSTTEAPTSVGAFRRAPLHPYVSMLAASVLAGGDHQRSIELEGTLAFFDISGFTPMTERLAALGRAGAEYINDVLNVVFTGLIDVAFLFGGDVLEFGGDAMVVLYTGHGHERRAAAAAAEMYRVMARNRRQRTPAGPVELGMSCGIASGRQPFYLLGSTRRALVVAGPVSTAMAMLEAAATSGQAFVDASTAGALPADWVVRSGGGTPDSLAIGRIRSGARHEADSPADEGIVDTRMLLPTEFRDMSDAGRQAGELKQVAMAFLRLNGTDDLLAARGPQAVFEMLAEITHLVDTSAAELGVCWLETQAEANSVRWTLIAGAPTATERDGERLLRVLRRIADGSPAPLRIGANLGVVYVGDMGHPRRCTYIVMGDATNVAARLMGRAEPGEIIAGERLVSAVGAGFESVDLEPFTVKGKRDPIPAALIGAVADRALSFEGVDVAGSARFVGRECELDELLRAIDAGVVAELFGGPGVGKSRLWQEAARLRPGRRWLVTRAEPHEATSAYLPVRRLVRRLAGIAPETDARAAGAGLTEHVRDVAPQLLPWLPLIADVAAAEVGQTSEVDALDDSFRADRQRLAVVELITAAEGTVVVFEDVQWMDRASLAVLDLLTRTARTDAAVILTRRSGSEVLFADLRLDLGAIGEDEALQLLLSELPPAHASDATLARLARSAAGNPLFLIELARATARSGPLDAYPESVERLMAARIDQLSPDQRSLVRDMSVLGATVDLELAAVVLERPELADADQHDPVFGEIFAVDEDRARFRHDLLRLASYEGLSVRRRRHIHTRAGDAIEALGDVADADRLALLAHHATGSDIPERIVLWNRRAAEQAIAKGAADVAETLLGPVIDAQRRIRATPADRQTVLAMLATAAERAGHAEHALDALTRAARLAPQHEKGRLAVERSRLLEKLGRYRAANVAIGRALTHCNDPVVDAQLKLSRATIHSFRGEWRRCLELTEALLSNEALDDPSVTAQAHLLSEWCTTAMGRPGAQLHAAEAERLMLELDDSIGLANLYLNRGISAWSRCDVNAAIDDFRQSSERYSRAGDVVGAALADNNLAEILTLQFRLDPAEQLLQRARRVMTAADYPLGVTISLSGLSRIAAWRGDVSSSIALQRRASEGFEQLGADDYVLDSMVRMAEIHLLAGAHQQALADIARAEAKVRAIGSVAVVPATLARLAGRVAFACGRSDEARQAFERALAIAGVDQFEYEVALAEIGLGRIDGDAHRISRAMATLDRLGGLQPPPGTRSPDPHIETVTTSSQNKEVDR